MNTALKEFTYPYITFDPDIAGGVALIEGTRITVRCVAGYYQMGMTVDEILNSLSHLTASQIHAALTYYFDHQEEIDRQIEENNDISHLQSQVKNTD
jgi:uncharacterized protein (DUF433 family)